MQQKFQTVLWNIWVSGKGVSEELVRWMKY